MWDKQLCYSQNILSLDLLNSNILDFYFTYNFLLAYLQVSTVTQQNHLHCYLIFFLFLLSNNILNKIEILCYFPQILTYLGLTSLISQKKWKKKNLNQ